MDQVIENGPTHDTLGHLPEQSAPASATYVSGGLLSLHLISSFKYAGRSSRSSSMHSSRRLSMAAFKTRSRWLQLLFTHFMPRQRSRSAPRLPGSSSMCTASARPEQPRHVATASRSRWHTRRPRRRLPACGARPPASSPGTCP
jgi:hypothetical protein